MILFNRNNTRENSFLILVGCIGFIILVGIERWQVKQWRAAKTTELGITTQFYKNRLQQAILSRFNAVESLGALFALNPEISPGEFEYFASLMLKHNPPIRALQYADPETRVKYCYPPKGNEITISNPMLLISDPDRGPYVKKAIDSKKAVLQGPYALRQGGMGVVVRSPIFNSQHFIGLAIGVYNVNDLLEEILKNTNLNQFSITISDALGNSFLEKGDSSKYNSEQSVHIADTFWTLSLALKKDFLYPPGATRILIWVMGSALILLLLVLFRLNFAQTIRLEEMVLKRTRDLHDMNEKLMGEIAERKKFEVVLKESESRFKKMIEKSPFPMMITDSTNNTMSYNERFMEDFGYCLDEINTADKWWKHACPDESYREQNKHTWSSAIDKSQGTHSNVRMQEWDVIIKNGTKRSCEFYMVPLGNFSLTIIKDITAQKQAEQAIEAHRTHLEKKVEERTVELREKVTELERMNDLFVGREFRIKELRDRINALEGDKQ
ncbi:CHASE domain-containing protein [Desulfocicer niacini]